jgi:hypothetical protein
LKSEYHQNKKSPPFGELFGAKDEVRTRDLLLGKEMLYQLSYFRLRIINIACFFGLGNISDIDNLKNPLKIGFKA